MLIGFAEERLPRLARIDVAALLHRAIHEQRIGRAIDVAVLDEEPPPGELVLEERACAGLILRLHVDSGERDGDLRAVAIDDDRLSIDRPDEADHARAGGRCNEEGDEEDECGENACDSIHGSVCGADTRRAFTRNRRAFNVEGRKIANGTPLAQVAHMESMKTVVTRDPIKWAGIAAASGLGLGFIGRYLRYRARVKKRPQLYVIEGC